MKNLLVGLGNIGLEYTYTRHNIGFEVIEHFARQHQLVFRSVHLGLLATLNKGNHSIYLLKPTTYMNQSGHAVQYWVHKLQIPMESLLIIMDDIHLPLGQLRLRPQGGSGGHNGLKSIQKALGTQAYPKLRFGIGNTFTPGQQATYVLSKFTKAEQSILQPQVAQAVEMIFAFCQEGLSYAMNHYN